MQSESLSVKKSHDMDEGNEPMLPFEMLDDKEYFQVLNVIGALPDLSKVKSMTEDEIATMMEQKMEKLFGKKAQMERMKQMESQRSSAALNL